MGRATHLLLCVTHADALPALTLARALGAGEEERRPRRGHLPETTLGRIITSGVARGGIGFVTVLTGTVAQRFLGSHIARGDRRR